MMNARLEKKKQYNKENYLPIYVLLDKQLVSDFTKKCKDTGISKASIFKQAIENFLTDGD